MIQLVPLDTWAARRYPERTPHITTVRKWVRDGKIYPAPVKHGRGYYVQPDAQYVTDAMLRDSIHVATPSR